VVTDIDLDPQSGATRCLDLGDRGVRRHVLGLGLEFLKRAQVQVSDRDLGPQSGEPLRIGPSKAAGCAGDDRHFAVQLAHGGSLLCPLRVDDGMRIPVSGPSKDRNPDHRLPGDASLIFPVNFSAP
jgi:hypothetical protein